MNETDFLPARYADPLQKREFEIWTTPEPTTDKVNWHIHLDGQDLGGGTEATHALCIMAAGRFLQDTRDGCTLAKEDR